MSTKSSQHPNSPGSSSGSSSGRVPFQARHKVVLVTVIILLAAAGAWITVYTHAVGTAPLGGKVPVISPTESAPQIGK